MLGFEREHMLVGTYVSDYVGCWMLDETTYESELVVCATKTVNCYEQYTEIEILLLDQIYSSVDFT